MTHATPTETITIPFIEGDGIGTDIGPVVRAIVDRAVHQAYSHARSIEWLELQAGEAALEATGSYLPEATLEALRSHPVAIKGPLGTPTGGGNRSLNVTLRQTFDLYACVRPVRYFAGVPSPMKRPDLVNVTIFRENVEDIYAGIEWEAGTDEARSLIKTLQDEYSVTSIRFPETSSIGIKPISEEGSKRLVRAAIRHALAQATPRVTLVHKGNIQKFTEGGFRRWGYEVAQTEFAEELADGRLVVNDLIADNFFQQALLWPDQFDVVAMTNLNGDYASDALAAQVGGLGLAPGANINYEAGIALFEATHGTAPDIAGQDKANPTSLLLSAVMMLDHLGWTEAGELIMTALETVIQAGTVTGDLGRFIDNATIVGTKGFGEALIVAME